jgi:hypothetical protein
MSVWDELASAASAYNGIATSSRLETAKRVYLLKLGDAVRSLAPSEPATSDLSGVSVDDLVSDMWPLPGETPMGSGRRFHEGGNASTPLPGFGPYTGLDWAFGSRGGSLGSFVNVWGHAFIRSGERRVRVQYIAPQLAFLVGGSWQIAAAPSTAVDEWAAWTAPPFTFLTQSYGVRSEPVGRSLDLSPSTVVNNWFIHWAWNSFWPRKQVPAGCQGVSVQCAMRLLPAVSGVDISSSVVIAGVGLDNYDTASSPGGSANPSVGIPAYKRLSGGWREVGYCNLTAAQIRANPPPLLTLPG